MRSGPGEATRVPASRGETAALRRDLHSLLAGAVGQLRDATGCDCVGAWALRLDGTPGLAAASYTGEPPPQPDLERFGAAAALARASDLSAAELPVALRELAREQGGACAAAVRGVAGAPLAVLLLARCAARPRDLAALDAAARRIAGPVAAALAARRLGRLDDEVRRLDRLAALGRLSAEIAHEVRNPLVSVKSFLQLLPERRDDPEFVGDFLHVVSDEIRRIERLLDLVIETAQPAEPTRAAADVATVLEGVGRLLRHHASTRGVTLEVGSSRELPEVALAADALRQVVLNLALNAVEATPGGGRVEIEARRCDDGVEIAISDDGPGIPEDRRARIAEPFFSTRADRAGGLGLSISLRIVQEAGGALAVGDAPGGGARISVRLPLARPGTRPRSD
jgi:signal transduction histidine kinase